MDETKLEKLYDDAPKSQVLKMWKLSDTMESQADVIQRKAESIKSNIRNLLKKKFSGSSKHDMEERENEQIKEMDKQWRLMAASMVAVRRSIQLSDFHNSLNLYVHPRYGIKEHKRYSGYSPFGYLNIQSMLKTDYKRFEIQGSKLIINNEEYLDFDVLDNIPQLNQERVKMFAGITSDLVGIIHSWLEFYGANNEQKQNDITLLNHLAEHYRNLDDEEYLDAIKRMDELLKLKERFDDELVIQKAKWQAVIEKWQKLNKNFVVLAELSKTHLNI